jgi:flagellar biosynthesis protein FlhB
MSVAPNATPNLIIEPLTITAYYQIVRGQIEHEDNLMGTRLNWFITSQSFFFSAYAIDVTSIFSAAPPAGSDVLDTRQLLRLLIPVVSIIASGVILLTIAAGVMAMHNLRSLFQRHVASANLHELPPVQGFRRTWAMGLAAPLLLPIVFLIVWTFLLLHNPHVKHPQVHATSSVAIAASISTPAIFGL